MGLLDSVLGFDLTEPGYPGPDDPFWYGEVGSATPAGVSISEGNAETISAVFACVNVLAETAASLGIQVMERQADGRAVVNDALPLALKLGIQPNPWQTAFEWIEMMQGHVALRGNAFSEIKPGGDGFVSSLIPLHPDRVVGASMAPSGRVLYRYDDPNEGIRTIPQEFMFHLRTRPGRDGIMGQSRIELALTSMGLAKAAELYASKFYGQGSSPPGILTTESELDEDTYRRILTHWKRTNSGVSNAHKVAILEGGLQWQQVGISGKDAQMLESRKWQVHEIARIWRMPLRLIQEGQDTKVGNISAEGRDFLTYCMAPWFSRWCARGRVSLISRSQWRRRFLQFDTMSITRGTLKERWETWAVGVQNAWLGPEWVQRTENLPDQPDAIGAPVGGGSPNLPASSSSSEPDDGGGSDTSGRFMRASRIVAGVVDRMTTKELGGVRRLCEDGDDGIPDRGKLTEFYSRHEGLVSRSLNLPPAFVADYCERRRDEVFAAGVARVGDEWREDGARELELAAIGGV